MGITAGKKRCKDSSGDIYALYEVRKSLEDDFLSCTRMPGVSRICRVRMENIISISRGKDGLVGIKVNYSANEVTVLV